jgi:hypothetical protein
MFKNGLSQNSHRPALCLLNLKLKADWFYEFLKFPLALTILSVICFGLSCATTQQLPAARASPSIVAHETDAAGLTESQAVEFAEKFIARNGYTDLPPDKENLAHESIEWESNTDEMLKKRHDTLERKAFGVVRHGKGSAAGWTVVFKYKNPSDRQMRQDGRAIAMNPNGSNARVEHKDFILAKIDRKL